MIDRPSYNESLVRRGQLLLDFDVISGHITSIGKPYAVSQFGDPTPTSAPLVPSWIIFALDSDTGKKTRSSTLELLLGLVAHPLEMACRL